MNDNAVRRWQVGDRGHVARATEFSPVFRPIWIWDLTDKVGWGLVKRRADVQLVQLSINKLIPKLGLVDFRKKGGTGPLPGMIGHPPLGALKVDGYTGNETANAIRSYIPINTTRSTRRSIRFIPFLRD